MRLTCLEIVAAGLAVQAVIGAALWAYLAALRRTVREVARHYAGQHAAALAELRQAVLADSSAGLGALAEQVRAGYRTLDNTRSAIERAAAEIAAIAETETGRSAE